MNNKYNSTEYQPLFEEKFDENYWKEFKWQTARNEILPQIRNHYKLKNYRKGENEGKQCSFEMCIGNIDAMTDYYKRQKKDIYVKKRKADYNKNCRKRIINEGWVDVMSQYNLN